MAPRHPERPEFSGMYMYQYLALASKSYAIFAMISTEVAALRGLHVQLLWMVSALASVSKYSLIVAIRAECYRLTRIRRHFVVYFCLHRGKCPLKGGRMASLFAASHLCSP